MFKRLFYGLLGLGAGLAVGVYAVQKVEAAQRALRPEAMAQRASARAGSLSDRLRAAVEEGKQAAAARETELRAVYRGGGRGEPAPGSPAPQGRPEGLSVPEAR